MLATMIEDLFIKYRRVNDDKIYVYVHNFSAFDSIFLLGVLADGYKFKIIKRDDKIISLTVSKF